AESFTDFDAGAKQALRVLAFSPVVDGLTTLAVGDRVDMYGSVWRHTNDGQNELYFEMGSIHPGCMKKVGTGNPVGTPGADLVDLTHAANENTHGPLLVKLETVSGKPNAPTE